MSKKRMTRRVFSVVFALLFMITGVTIPTLTPQAATEMDLSSYITMSGTTDAAKDNGENKGVMITELLLNLPEDMDEKSEWEAKGIKSLSMSLSVSGFTAGTTGTPGAMMMFMSKDWKWNQGNYVNLTTSGTMEMSMDLSSLDWGNSTEVGKIGIQFTNLQEGSTVTYQINSVKFSTDAVSSGGSGGSSGGSGTVTIPSGNVKDYNYSDIEYNYAKLLQYSLYFYDANMCGSEVGEKSLLNWRDDCHTYDKYNYTRSDGSTVTVDLTGGFHDAGDHVKFGLPEAYAAFVLGMSYDTNKNAYASAKQTGHIQTLTTHFADYLTKCAVLNKAGTAVEAYCVQVGNGGGGFDHGYWGAPESQPQSNRTAYFSSASTPHTDIVSLSAASLAMQYKNFGGDKYLQTAKLLFEYAKNNSKSAGTTAGSFYASSNWEDDYCLAALMLYQVTGDTTYKTEYDRYKYSDAAMKPYWPLGWDNVGPAVAYYDGNSGKLSTLMGISDGNSTYGGYRCLSDWGSARYNTSLQYVGLLYDKLSSTDSYRNWAEGQMKYLLGNNAAKQCFVIGYNAYGPKYPHHRAASGYTGGDKGTTAQKNVLLGALVGGQKTDGSYTDSASDYICNEVALDYNATLVAAAAAIYEKHTADADQKIDSAYYTDGSSSVDPDPDPDPDPEPKPDPEPEKVAVTGVTIDKQSLSMEVGDTARLTATVAPSNADDKTYTWSVGNQSVATIDKNGTVTAKGAGTTTITVTTTDGGFKANCTVTVTKKPDPEPKPDPVIAKPGMVKNVKGVTLGKNKVKITWNQVADADGYLVYAMKNGKYGYCGITKSKTKASFVDTKALDENYGFYWVYAYKLDNNGKRIVGSCEKYGYGKGVTIRVNDLKASSQKGGVKLTWSKSANADGYLIYGKTRSGKYGYIGMTSKLTYFDTKASKTEYNFYWVFPYHKSASGKLVVGQISAKYVYGKAR